MKNPNSNLMERIEPEPVMLKYIHKQNVLTLATSVNDRPYCCNCFYAVSDDGLQLYFKSEEHTRHIEMAVQQPVVAGTILPVRSILGKVVGMQFTGVLTKADDALKKAAEASYYKRYPFARAMSGDLWTIRLESLKYTDYKLGFGKKLLWSKDHGNSHS